MIHDFKTQQLIERQIAYILWVDQIAPEIILMASDMGRGQPAQQKPITSKSTVS